MTAFLASPTSDFTDSVYSQCLVNLAQPQHSVFETCFIKTEAVQFTLLKILFSTQLGLFAMGTKSNV